MTSFQPTPTGQANSDVTHSCSRPWVSGVGSLAGFLALLLAVLEWRSGQVERRDREADQARLMIAELVTDRRRAGGRGPDRP